MTGFGQIKAVVTEYQEKADRQASSPGAALINCTRLVA